MRSRDVLLLALATTMMVGCYRMKKPDQAICRSAVANVCSTLEDLDSVQSALTGLHDQQMKRWDELLAAVSEQLKQPETYPLPVVELTQPKTKGWKDPQGSYAVKSTLKLHYDKGRDRYQAFPELKAAMEALDAYEKEAGTAWKAHLKAQEREVRIPERVSAERRQDRISFVAGKSITVLAPAHLLRKHWKAASGSAHAVVGFVVTKDELAHKIVHERSVAIYPAFERSHLGLFGYVIRESRARTDVHHYTTSVSYSDLCSDFRAELRFVPAGEVAPRAWALRRKAQDEGGSQ
jgi:hypothetical protein